MQFNVSFQFADRQQSLRAICMLLLFMAAARGTWSKAFLGLPWVALIGGACYSIYLVHVPVIHAGAQILSKFVVFRSLGEAWVISWAVLVPVTLTAECCFTRWSSAPA